MGGLSSCGLEIACKSLQRGYEVRDLYLNLSQTIGANIS